MKAYLAWPVKFNPYAVTGITEGHITFKYIGEVKKAVGLPACIDGLAVEDKLYTEALIAAVTHLLAGVSCQLDLDDCSWSPEVFNPVTRVMVITGIPLSFHTMRIALHPMRFEDYPTWRPHITLPGRAWAHISRKGVPLHQCIESVGPLTLYVDHKPVATFA